MDWTYKNFVIYEFNELDSTNKTAFDMALAGKISNCEIILAKKQNAGRGRLQRNWDSPAGNLYFSLVIKPQVAINKIPELSFVAIAALRLAIEKIVPNSVKNKWPNDLLVDEKKVAGLLLESESNGQNCEFVVIGIGVNLVSNPQNTMFPASNLAICGIKISPHELLKKFLDEFENLYQVWLDFGFTKISKIWLQQAYRLNEIIKIKIDETEVSGIFAGIDEVGNLLLNQHEIIRKISVADVS